MFRPAVVIPVYDHGGAVGAVVQGVLATDLHCIVVDDGSGPECARTLEAIVASAPDRLTLSRRPTNGGKGAAVLTGLAHAHALGFTHAVQIDADGQHDPGDIAAFVALAQARPAAMITGRPIFDDSVPTSRLYWRGVTHVLVWVHTLSGTIRDSMCGFRVYPIQTVLDLAQRVALGRRMDFDIEILVRLYWDGVDIVSRATPVRYPLDGVSHFRLWRDNALIARLHAMLFLGMLARLPRLIARHRTAE
jgi:glycosyltransferase involved in cell wall biosynthesis